jgi:phosphopantothenoylcysteine decarboxylase/phosphopantothenate--cysteine ligase
MGFALAESLAARGAEVWLIAGPVSLNTASPLIRRINITTAEEMYKECVELFPEMDGAILCAAVADYRPTNPSNKKIKKAENEDLIIRLERNKDILEALGKIKTVKQVIGGFSLETHDEEKYALEKLERKNCDFIVLNSLNTKGAGFGVDTNQVIIFDRRGQQIALALKSKKEVAEDIVDFMIKNYL